MKAAFIFWCFLICKVFSFGPQVMLIGPHGSGKSTLANFLAQNDSLFEVCDDANPIQDSPCTPQVQIEFVHHCIDPDNDGASCFPLILIDTPGWGINFPIDFQSFDKIVNGTKTLKTLNKILWLNQKPISEDEYSLVFMRQLVAKYGRNIWQGVTLLNSNSSDSTLCQTLILEVRQHFNIFNQINCYEIDETNRILVDIIVSKSESFDFVDYDKAMEDSREQANANAIQIQLLKGEIQGLRGSIWNLRQVLYSTESDVGRNDREISKLKLKDTDFSIDLSDLRLELSRTDLFAKATGFSTLGLIGGILLFGIIAFISYQVYNRKK